MKGRAEGGEGMKRLQTNPRILQTPLDSERGACLAWLVEQY